MPKTVLVAEDSVTMRKVFQLAFAAEDVDVVAQGSCDEALATVRANPPDLVIADLSMPSPNGYDLCATLRKEGVQIPILLVHGKASTFDADRARRMGASGHLEKPFETETLISVAQRLMKEARSRPSGQHPVAAAAAAPAVQAAPSVAAASKRGAVAQKRAGTAGVPPVAPAGTPLELTIEAEPPPPVSERLLPFDDVVRGGPTWAEAPHTLIGTPIPQLPNPPAGLPMPGHSWSGISKAPQADRAVRNETSAYGAPGGRSAAGGTELATTAPPSGAYQAVDPKIYQAITELSRDVVERIVWEVVPALAERLIREHIEQIDEQRKR